MWMMSTALYAMRPTGTADNETIRHTGQAAKGGLPLLCLKGGRCEEIQHYLCRPAVSELSEKDSILFLWTTFPQLREALRVIKAWGFEYKSVAFVWLKLNKSGKGWFYGLGFWTRGNAEICLLATKGHPKRKSNRVHQFIISPLRGHSQKPDEARDKIIELVGDLPRVELFAREKADGWDA